MFKRILLLLTFLPIFILADTPEMSGNFDIVPRTVNFLIFFGILFYFLKNIAKKAYNDRINGIISRLETIETKLEDSKEKKKQSIKDLELAKSRAVELVEIAKKEIELLKQKSLQDIKYEIKSLEKSFEEQKEFSKKRITKDVVKDVLNEVFEDKSIQLEQKELIDIVEKRVS